MNSTRLFPAGWALRGFTPEQFLSLVAATGPPLVELSKDFLDDKVSLKGLARKLAHARDSTPCELVLAGTTDLVDCSGFSWSDYRKYLAVQVAQAKFLGCTGFRLFSGSGSSPLDDKTVIDRIGVFCDDLAPIQACVEIHGGLESDPAGLFDLLRRTPVKIVVDVEGQVQSGLTTETLRTVLPPDRIAYFHIRNLPGIWVEQPETLDLEEEWRSSHPDSVFLWEPKTMDDPERIRECFLEYRAAH